MAVVIHHRYNPPPRRALLNADPVITKQAHKEECDINTIMARYARTGVAPGTPSVARYGDFYGVEDFMQAQLVLKQAQGQFAGLPAKVRDRFGNSPDQLLAFVQDKNNLEEARKLGLLRDEVPAKVEPNPPPPGA